MASTIALSIAAPCPGAVGHPADATAAALAQCLDDAANAATAGQSMCEAAARRAYDRRMNRAFTSLMRILPPGPAQRLLDAQRAWLGFRDREAAARSALYGTRRGTLFVPMEAAGETAIVRDRALQLEAYGRIMRIEP